MPTQLTDLLTIAFKKFYKLQMKNWTPRKNHNRLKFEKIKVKTPDTEAVKIKTEKKSN